MPTNYPPFSSDSENFALVSLIDQKIPQVLLDEAPHTLRQTAALTGAAR
jgi:hypothetical protein